MPELPEVETVVRELRDARLVGRCITAVRVRWERTLDGIGRAEFRRRVVGRTVSGVNRRAKYIRIILRDAGEILLHLRMTGRLGVVPAARAPLKYERLAFELDDGKSLRFSDVRKFGRCRWVAAGEAALARLGPEPLDAGFTAKWLVRALAGRKRMLKPLLLDQGFVAGLGNIYVDEALWEAGLHPCRLACSLTEGEATRLHRAIRTVLFRGVRALGTSLGSGETNFRGVAGHRGRNQDALRVFRRTGQPCRRCRDRTIVRIIVGQRSSHVCPGCQLQPDGA